jgi:hypothetical protein
LLFSALCTRRLVRRHLIVLICDGLSCRNGESGAEEYGFGLPSEGSSESMVLTTPSVDDTVSLPLFVSFQVLTVNPIYEGLAGTAGFIVGFLSGLLLTGLWLLILTLNFMYYRAIRHLSSQP